MKTTIILASFIAAFASAAPFESTSLQPARGNPTPIFYTPTPGDAQPTSGPVISGVETSSKDVTSEPIEMAPLDLESRQTPSVRVLLAFDTDDTAVQANLPRNGQRVSIRAKFAALGNPLLANRGNIVSGGGTCIIFRDPAGRQQVAVLQADGDSVSFGGNVNLQNGVIVCM